MRTPHRLLVLPASAVLVLSLAACGGKADPAPTSGAAAPSTSGAAASTTASSSPASSSPEVKAEKPDPKRFPHMKEKTKQGAQETYDYFVEAYQYSLLTGDPRYIEEVTGRECKVCVTLANEARSGGPQFRSVRLSNTEDHLVPEGDGVILIGQNFRAESVGLDGASGPKQTVAITGRMRWVGDRWTLNNLGIEVGK